MPTTFPDWRVGPDPLRCTSCTATEAACDNKQMFAGRHCCEACDHPPPKENQ